jgi:hypothetical protein
MSMHGRLWWGVAGVSKGFFLFVVLCASNSWASNTDELELWMKNLAAQPASPQAALSSDGSVSDASRSLRSMVRKVIPEAMTALQVGTPELLSAGDGSDVWGLTANGSSGNYFLAMCEQQDKWQPLYFCVTGLAAQDQASFDDAINRVKQIILPRDIEKVEVSALRNMTRRTAIDLQTWNDKEVDIPWSATWVFMIDDDPLANWEHPCRYVFVSQDLSSIAVRYAMTPLSVQAVLTTRNASAVESLEVVVPFDYPAALPTSNYTRASNPLLKHNGSVSNCYAVIISGGADKANNHIRYWGDVSHMYSTLTVKYGYPKTNVYVLVSDGLDPAIDRSDDTNSPFDLDGDGRNDTMAAATPENVSIVFARLEQVLTPNDQLFVFTTDHGGPSDGGEWDVHLNLWNLEVLTDAEFKAMTENIQCPVYFAMEQCYGGGFIDDLNQSNRLITTSARYNESSYAGNTFPWFNQWAYHWTAALRGSYPQQESPWLDGESCDADYNEDGFVSFEEARLYAQEHKYPIDHPMHDADPESLAKSSFLFQPNQSEFGVGELCVGFVPSLLIKNTLTPLTITAQNVFGDIITNYNGTVKLWAEAQPLDPGFYVGTNTIPSAFPLNTSYMDSRVQVIYPPEIMGEIRTLDYLQLNVEQAPSIVMSNLTIRLKHISMTAFPTNPVWDNQGWTTVYTSNLLLNSTGWVNFAFSTPFEYNGSDSLMIDFSLNNDDYDDGGSFLTSTSTANVAIGFVSDNEFGDPLAWSGSMPPPQLSSGFPNLRFGPPPVPVSVTMTPTNISGFVNGVWTGQFALFTVADDVKLHVQDDSHNWGGTSALFDVKSSYRTNYVDASGLNPIYPYASWGSAATTLQDALDVAREGSIVLVADGVYNRGGAVYEGLTNRAVLRAGVVMCSAHGADATVIVGAADQESGNEYGLGPAAVRGVVLGPGAILDGFTVRDGHTTTNGVGGGVYANHSSVISSCIFRDNAAYNGGALYVTGEVSVATSLIENNRSQNAGGGVYLDGTGQISSCTIVTNTAGSSGGGIYFAQSGHAKNTIIYHNASGLSGKNIYDASGSAVIEYCCVLPEPGGVRNITGDPGFTSLETHDFSLTEASSCIDAGEGVPGYDLSGVLRPLDGVGDGTAAMDIGAYEFFNQQGDTDADGMRDGWEITYGLNLHDPSDALLNPDQDSVVNRDEATADTNPFDRNSYLRIDTLHLLPEPALGYSPASTNRVYTIQARDTLLGSEWTNVTGATHVRPQATGAQSIPLPQVSISTNASQYFRLKVEYP